jgi:hypothetical protein
MNMDHPVIIVIGSGATVTLLILLIRLIFFRRKDPPQPDGTREVATHIGQSRGPGIFLKISLIGIPIVFFVAKCAEHMPHNMPHFHP